MATVTPQASGGFSDEQFKALFRFHPAGVAIITLMQGQTPVGFTATSVISVSAAPAVIAFSVQATSSSWVALASTDSLIIHFLSEDQQHLATRFATSGINRFADVQWVCLPTGEPLLLEAGTWTRCTVRDRHQAGGSFLVQVSPEQGCVQDLFVPIIYQGRGFHKLGARVP